MSNHGVVVRLDGMQITGFVHVSEISNTYISHPSDKVEEGEKVRVCVIKATDDFLGLSMIKLGRKGLDDYTVGQEVEGRVVQVTQKAAWVDIGAQGNCQLHVDQIEGTVYDARAVFQVGDTIKARIRFKDEARGKPTLTMLPAREVLMPLQRGQKLADLKEGQELGGQVLRITKFGVFVDVGAEADGLVHIRNINDGIVVNLEDWLKPRDPVTVKVLGFPHGLLELTLTSPPLPLPAVDAFKDIAADEWVYGNVVGKVNFGALIDVEAPNGDTATALLERKDIPYDVWAGLVKGTRIQVRITKVDTDKKQVFLKLIGDDDVTSDDAWGAAADAIRDPSPKA